MNYSSYTTKTIEEIEKTLATSVKDGLSHAEAEKRIGQYGKNEISHRDTTLLELLRRQCASSFIYLLVVAAILSFILGERVESLLIIIFVSINIALGFFQEYSSQKTLKFLSLYLTAHAHVKRDGAIVEIPTSSLVPGDIVVLEPGSMIPADLRFIDEKDLFVDESPLTGESIPIEKQATSLLEPATEVFRAQNIGFEGTSVVRGSGVGVVIGTGMQTVFGGIAKSTVEITRHTAFEKQLDSFSSFIVRLVLITLFCLLLVNIWIKGGQTSIIDLLIFSIALAVSVIPESLPLVVTFSLSHGAKRLALKKVVVKRLSAIEDLGSIDVLCTDKTGTLTENLLTVASVLPYKKSDPLFLACTGTPHLHDHLHAHDPFDTAVWNALPAEKRTAVMKYRLSGEIPFDPIRKRNTIAVTLGRSTHIITRGAYEEVIKQCTGFTKKDHDTWSKWIAEEGKQGRRVLALAVRTMVKKDVLDLSREEAHLRFAGLVSFADPLKKTAHDAVIKARSMGVQVKILTGDSIEVARTVARAIGLITVDTQVIAGHDFEALSMTQQKRAVEDHVVFARVSPDQKLRIIHLLQHDHTVGFLGDGINDAPALKIAHVAIVVQGCSDIAREAADIVLLKKSLGVIIDGIHEGREVFANTIKYIRTTLTSNFGNFYSVAIAALFIPYLPMLPLQILLVNIITDFPLVAISSDSVDPSEVNAPRQHQVKDILLIALILGPIGTIFDFIIFAIFRVYDPAVLQTMWFMGSILTELVLFFSIRTRLFFLRAQPPSFPLVAFSAIGVAITLILPYSQLGQQLFSFRAPSVNHLTMLLVLVGLYFVFSELIKVMYYRHLSRT